MGIFDSIQDEIDAREKRSGITPADLLDLPPMLRRLMNRVTRKGEHTVAEAAEFLEESPDDVRRMLDGLAEKGYLEREKKEVGWVYRTRFARKRGRKVPGGIWSMLGQQPEEE